MKLSGRYRYKRLLLAVAILLFGLLAGFLVGRQSILHATKARMEQYSDQILQREDEIGDEITNTLSEANETMFSPCTEDDIALLRRLTFKARFLKDVGRLENDSFLCSASAVKVPMPERMSES